MAEISDEEDFVPCLTQEEIEYRTKSLRAVIADDPVRRVRHCVLQKAFHRWACTFPLAQTNGELIKQLQERIKALQTVRESYLRDVISIKYHLEKLTETAILSRNVVTDTAGMPSTDITAMIESVKRTPDQSSTQLRESLMKAGIINPYTGEALNPWESSRCFKSYKKYEKGAKYRMPTGGTSVHLHAPNSHKLFVKYCKSCVGMMSLVYEWNEEVEQALITWRASEDKEYEAEKQKKVKALIERLNTAIYEKEEENARLSARLHLVESANEWYETWQYGLEAKQTTEKLLDQVTMLKNQTGMGKAEKESMEWNNADRVTRAMADHVTREKKMKSTLENTLQRLENERVAKDRLNAQMESVTNEVLSQEEAMASYKETNEKLREQVTKMNVRWENDQTNYRDLLIAMEKKEKDMLEYKASTSRQVEEFQSTIEGMTVDYDAHENTIDENRDTIRTLKRSLAIAEQNLSLEKQKNLELESTFKRDRKLMNKELLDLKVANFTDAQQAADHAAAFDDIEDDRVDDVPSPVDNVPSPLDEAVQEPAEHDPYGVEMAVGYGGLGGLVENLMFNPHSGRVVKGSNHVSSADSDPPPALDHPVAAASSASGHRPRISHAKWTLKRVAKFVLHNLKNVAKDNNFLYEELVKHVPEYKKMDDALKEERKNSKINGAPVMTRRNYRTMLTDNNKIKLPSHSEILMRADALNIAEGRIIELEQQLERLQAVCVKYQIQSQLQRSLAVQLRDCLFVLRAKFHLTALGLQQQQQVSGPVMQVESYCCKAVFKEVVKQIRKFMRKDRVDSDIRPFHITAFDLKRVCGDITSMLRTEFKKNPPKFVAMNPNHELPKFDGAYDFDEGYTSIADHYRDEEIQVKSLCTSMYTDLYEIEKTQTKMRLERENETNDIVDELNYKSSVLEKSLEKSKKLTNDLSQLEEEKAELLMKNEKLEKKLAFSKGKKHPKASPIAKSGSLGDRSHKSTHRMSLAERTKSSLGRLNGSPVKTVVQEEVESVESSPRAIVIKKTKKVKKKVVEDVEVNEEDEEEDSVDEVVEAQKQKKKNEDRQASLSKHSLYSMNNASFKNRRTPAVNYVTVKAEKFDSDDETESDCEVVDLVYDEDSDDHTEFFQILPTSYLMWKRFICTMLTIASDRRDDELFEMKLKEEFNGTIESLSSDKRELRIFRENEPFLQEDLTTYRIRLEEYEQIVKVNDSTIGQLRTDYAHAIGENQILRDTVEESYRTVTAEVSKKMDAHRAEVRADAAQKIANRRHRGTQIACSVCDIRQRFQRCQPIQDLGQGMLSSIDASTGYLRASPKIENDIVGSSILSPNSIYTEVDEDILLPTRPRDIRAGQHKSDRVSVKRPKPVYPGMVTHSISSQMSEELNAEFRAEYSAFEPLNVSISSIPKPTRSDSPTRTLDSGDGLHASRSNAQVSTMPKSLEGSNSDRVKANTGKTNKRRPMSANVCDARTGNQSVTKFSSLRNIPVSTNNPYSRAASPPTPVLQEKSINSASTNSFLTRPMSGSLTRRGGSDSRPKSGSVTRRDRPASGKPSKPKFQIGPQLPHCISATSAASFGHDAAAQQAPGPLLKGRPLSPATLQRLQRASQASLLQHNLVNKIGLTSNVLENDSPLVASMVTSNLDAGHDGFKTTVVAVVPPAPSVPFLVEYLSPSVSADRKEIVSPYPSMDDNDDDIK